MPITNNTCVCGKHLPLPTGSFDVKCEHCGRVYNQHGVFLWREDPGSAEITGKNTGEGEEDRRAPDQIAAAESALEAGTALPEEPRRAADATDPELVAASEQEGGAIGNDAPVGETSSPEGAANTPDASDAPVLDTPPAPRGEHTHKHEKGAGHKPFSRLRR